MNMHGDRLRLDHQPVATSDAGLSPLWAAAKTEHASSCATNLRQGPFAPLELPSFDATMNPSDSRRGQNAVMSSRVPLSRLPSSRDTSPGLSGSSRVCRYPPSSTTPGSRTAACAHSFAARAGFALYGRLATPSKHNEAESGSLALRLTASPSGASSRRVAPRNARSATWPTSSYHGQFLSTNKTRQAGPDAP